MFVKPIMDAACCFLSVCSDLGQTQGQQEELVRPESVCGGVCGRPVQEDGEMQQHTLAQVEAAAHCVSLL